MRKSLDTYDVLPDEMRGYLTHYGFHFSKKACEYAVSLMRRRDPSTGRKTKVELVPRERVKEMLKTNGVELEDGGVYDFVYVYHMGKADLWGSSIEDELHLARYVKDVIEDVDGGDEAVFRGWLAKMVGSGRPVDWEEMV